MLFIDQFPYLDLRTINHTHVYMHDTQSSRTIVVSEKILVTIKCYTKLFQAVARAASC